VFGGLAGLLVTRLHDLGLLASVLDMGHGNAAELLRRVQYSEARFVILHAGAHFPFAALEPNALAQRHVVAVIAWESDTLLDRVHRVLVDHAAASRVVEDHLWAAGHRHVLLAGPDDMIARARLWNGRGNCPGSLNVQGTGFEARWIRRGGRAASLVSHHEGVAVPACDGRRLLALLDGPCAPTAIVGLRDVDAWDVRETLRRVRPDALQRLAFVGSGDTPWSRTSHPPFTTLNWQLDEIADLACGVIRDIEAGMPFPKPLVRGLAPRLVVRP
jgi:DNA-binding LacI/PurR family transcriptional regulator